MRERLLQLQEEVHLRTQEVQFMAPIKKVNLKTFRDLAAKKTVRMGKNKAETVRATRDLFGRLVVIGQARKVNLEELLSFTLNIVPLQLAHVDCTMIKTVKANLLHAIEGAIPQEKSRPVQPQKCDVLLLDGMAALQTLTQIPETFGQIADKILQKVVLLAKAHAANTVHFVTDRYLPLSIKGSERSRRSSLTGDSAAVFSINSPEQKLNVSWKKYLTNGNNKTRLVQFLHQHWSSVPAQCLQGTVF